MPGLEEEGEEAGTGRGKHPAAPVLCDAMEMVTNPTPALHPSLRLAAARCPHTSPDTPSPSLSYFPPVAACPGLNASALRVGVVQELYAWVLQVPEPDLAMTFQEVRAVLLAACNYLPSCGADSVFLLLQILVDLSSKNTKGLYRAQVRATVGGRPTAFAGLVGLESDSLARSMPGLVALALEALKT